MAGYSGAARLIVLSFFVLAVEPRREGNRLQDPQAENARRQGYALLVSGRYPEAALFYTARATEAERTGQTALAALYWNNLGSSYLSFFQFTQALDAFVRSKSLAARARAYEIQAGATANISSLHLQNNDIESASALIESVLPYFNMISDEHNRASLQLQLGTVRFEQRRMAEGKRAMEAAIEHAHRAVASAGSRRNRAELTRAWSLVAAAHDCLGRIALVERNQDQAEWHLTEAFRIRTLFRLGKRAHSCVYLAQLTENRKDLAGALKLLDRAVELARTEPRISSVWGIRIARGKVRAALGNPLGALADYREALRLARRFRLDVLATDATRVLTDVRLDQAYDEFVGTAARQSRIRQEPALSREAFRAAEESRAASLWSLIRSSDRLKSAVPARYGELLAGLQSAETRLLSADTPDNRRQAKLLEAALLEIEAQSGYNRPVDTAGLVGRVQSIIPPDGAFLSFRVGQAESHVWAISRETFQVYFLPGAAKIERAIRQFSEAVRENSDASDQAGRELYDMLFRDLGPEFHAKRRWLLALDELLFEVPFCALPTAGGRYLVERHTLQIATGALFLTSFRPSGGDRGGGRFLGLGDAIYNTADPRWTRIGKPANLPRLVASGPEVERCARAWGGGVPILLTGTAASKPSLAKTTEERLAVVHMAVHVVQADQPDAPARLREARDDVRENLKGAARGRLIRLVLSPSGSPGGEYLGPDEIRNWRLQGTQVTVNGCSSGGRAVPGAGLLGLTRPWLAAGARAVTATRWPVADDEGRFFESMYRHLKGGKDSDPAAALAMAQIEMIRSGGKRALPGYWAAYFLVGNQLTSSPRLKPGILRPMLRIAHKTVPVAGPAQIDARELERAVDLDFARTAAVPYE